MGMSQKEFGLYITKLRENAGYKSQRKLCEASGVSNATINRIESGAQKAQPETLKRLAPYLQTTYEDLMMHAGYFVFYFDADGTERSTVSENPPDSAFSPKEERDIAQELERMMSNLESSKALAFDGEPMTEEDKELLRSSLEHSLRTARIVAKKKYTPKKYRKD